MSGRVLKDIGLYKTRILASLLGSSDFCELMLNKKNNTEEEIDGLLYTQVFPYLYTDDTQKEVLPYTCFEVVLPRPQSHTIKDMKIIFWCYAHKNCMKCSKKDYLGTRVDMLCDVIEQELRDSDDYGIGKVELINVDYIFPSNKYYGRVMTFTVPDFKIKDKNKDADKKVR